MTQRSAPHRNQRARIGWAVLLAASSVCVALARVPAQDAQPVGPALRPAVMGRSGGVSAGHPLTTAAAFSTLLRGGNAFDAGVAALLVGGVVEQDLYSLGGEALILVYPIRDRKVTSVVGQGWAPKAVSVDWYLSRGKTLAGAGLDPAVTPGAVHAALTVLDRWGTMSFEQVASTAIDYAERGFPLRASTARAIVNQKPFFDQWPGNGRNWYRPDGSYYKAGDTIVLPKLARTLRRMVEAERVVKRRRGRSAGIAAARDRFYKGDIAREMVSFLKAHDAPFELSDFAEFFAKVEEPAQTTYRGYTVYKHGFGSQGPSLLQTLNILENFDLAAMGYGSADYLHTLTEAMKLAYADRDTYYADPDFVQVPAQGLLSKEYARERAKLIDPRRASPSLVAGDPLRYDDRVKTWTYWKATAPDSGPGAAGLLPAVRDVQASLGLDSTGVSKDTTHIAVIDKDGNVFDATPSGGWIPGAVILGDTGIGISVRGEQFFLDVSRANHIRPRARPRYTLTPSLVFKDGRPLMALGTPGGDNQEQTILQALLSTIEFWDDWYPNLHSAFERPRVQTQHFHGSFWPHTTGLNRLDVEATVPEAVFEDLRGRGHDVRRLRPFGMSGCATAVLIDPASGSRFAAGDPRRDCYAMAY
jgi:gamma-glutamyltranspeptidase / glutathione hydrolase